MKLRVVIKILCFQWAIYDVSYYLFFMKKFNIKFLRTICLLICWWIIFCYHLFNCFRNEKRFKVLSAATTSFLPPSSIAWCRRKPLRAVNEGFMYRTDWKSSLEECTLMHSSNVPARRGSSRARNTSKVARLSWRSVLFKFKRLTRVSQNRKVDERQQSL